MSVDLLIYAGTLIIPMGLLAIGFAFAKNAIAIEESYAVEDEY